jgi:thioredoxin 1
MDELETIRARKLEELVNVMDAPTVTLEEKMPSAPVEVSDGNIMTMIKDYDFMVVDCWAPWCGPCRMLSPVIEELARTYSGKVVFGKLNTDNNRRVAGQFGIMSIPTLLFFKNGRHVDTIIGAVPKSVIEDAIRKYM